MPRYFTVNWRSSPALGGGSSVIDQPVGLVRELTRAAGGHFGDRHALAVGGGGEVERDLGDAVFDEAHGDGGLARDLVAVVVEGDAEDVVLDVDAGLARIIVGCGRRFPEAYRPRNENSPMYPAGEIFRRFT